MRFDASMKERLSQRGYKEQEIDEIMIPLPKGPEVKLLQPTTSTEKQKVVGKRVHKDHLLPQTLRDHGIRWDFDRVRKQALHNNRVDNALTRIGGSDVPNYHARDVQR